MLKLKISATYQRTKLFYLAKACSISAKISSGCSIPIDSLTYPGVTPAFNC
jgi:hypothetical protein